jgi:hypothetical protein
MHNPASLFKSAFARGYYAPGDGGGGRLYRDEFSVTSTNLGSRVKSAVTGWSLDLADKSLMSVKQFGCKGDGSTDDQARLVAAIGAVPSGGVLRLSAGTYASSTTLTVAKSNFKLIGDGWKTTKLVYSGAADLATFLAITGDNWTLEGIEVDGAGKAEWMTLAQGDDWTVRNCWLHGAYADDDMIPARPRSWPACM